MEKFYLPPKVFNEKYQKVSEIADARSNVVITKNFEVVKTANLEWCIQDVLYLTQFDHENIVNILNYTIDTKEKNIKVKYAMELGSSVKGVFYDQKELLTLIYDVTSGLKYLKDKGYIHGDVKPQNVVRMQNKNERVKYVLIDFGHSRPYINLGDGNGDIFYGTSYTLPFRDYQYYHDYNSISCELFSLGQTIRCILNKCKYVYSSVVTELELKTNMEKNFSSIDGKVKTEIISMVKSLMCDPPSSRISYEKILESEIFKSLVPLRPKLVKIHKTIYGLNTISQDAWDKTVYWFFFKFSYIFNLNVRGVFIVLHNVKRCLHKFQEKHLKLLFCTIAFLTGWILHIADFDIIECYDKLGEFFNPVIVIKMITEIVDILKGDFVPYTGWDNSVTPEDVLTNFLTELKFGPTLYIENSNSKKAKNYEAYYDDFFNYLEIPVIHFNCGASDIMSNIIKTIKYKYDTSTLWEFNPTKKLVLDLDLCISKKLGYSRIKFVFNEIFRPISDCGIIIHIDKHLTKSSKLAACFITELLTCEYPQINRYNKFIDMDKLNEVKSMSENDFFNLCTKTNIYNVVKMKNC